MNVTGFEKAGFHTHKSKTYFSPSHDSCTHELTIQAVILGKGNRYLKEICCNSIATYNLSIQQLLSKQLAELPAILDSSFLA